MDLPAFYRARGRRLLPALFACVLGTLVAYQLLLPADTPRLRGDALGALAYVHNWLLVLDQVPYAESFDRPSPLLHLWSLAVEAQLYLLWPLLLIAGLTEFRRRFFAVLTVFLAALSSLVMGLLYDPSDSGRVYFGTDTRAAGFLLGAALALFCVPWLRRRVVPLLARLLDVAAVLALVLLAVALAVTSEFADTLYREGGFAKVGLLTCVIIAAVAYPGTRISRGSRPRAPGLARAAVLRHLPLPLAGVRAHQARYRRARPAGPRGPAAGRRDAADRGGVLPVDRAAGAPGSPAPLVGRDRAAAARGGGAGRGERARGRADPELRPDRGAGRRSPRRAARPVHDRRPRRPVAPGAACRRPVPGRSGLLRASRAGEPPSSPPRPPATTTGALVVGDSVVLGSAAALRAALGPDTMVDGAVGRQFDRGPAIVRSWAATNTGPVVVHLGSNGIVRAEDVDALVAAAGARRVVLVNVAVPRRWQQPDNTALRAAAQRHSGQVVLVDWAALVAADPSLVGKDRVHPTPAGRAALAAGVRDALTGSG